MNARDHVVVLVALPVVAHRRPVDGGLGGAPGRWSPVASRRARDVAPRRRPPRGRSAHAGRRRRPAAPGASRASSSSVEPRRRARARRSARASMTSRTSSSVERARACSSRLRESSGEITEKNGFSVVAATSVTQRFSTPGSSASCWALLKRCTSSTNSTVSRPRRVRSVRAWSIAARTSLTPADTAETSTNARSVWPLTIAAIVVLPGARRPPQQQRHRLVALDQLAQRRPRRARSCGCPTSSSSVRGRIRTASGAEAWVLACSAPDPAHRRRGRGSPVVEEHVGCRAGSSTGAAYVPLTDGERRVRPR